MIDPTLVTLYCYALPVVMVLWLVVIFFTQIFPQTESYGKLKVWVKHECWHDWVKVGLTGELYHCAICRIELHEDNWHPYIKYKCSKCGAEMEEYDNLVLLNENGTPKND